MNQPAAKPISSIGPRIRTARLRAGLRLQDVADRAGFTKSLLSKIETGAVMPPIATLSAIAAALAVPVAALIDGGGAARTAVDRAGGELRTTDKGYRFRLLGTARGDKAMQPFVFSAKRGEVRPSGLRHAGEEFVHVLSGELDFRVGDQRHRLGEGDSIYFDSDEEHDVTPITASATWLAVFLDRPRAAAPAAGARAATKPQPSRTRAKRQPPTRPEHA